MDVVSPTLWNIYFHILQPNVVSGVNLFYGNEPKILPFRWTSDFLRFTIGGYSVILEDESKTKTPQTYNS